MLTQLTDRHRAAIPAYVARWIEWGLSCEPADRALVEDGIRRCYGFAGLPWHNRIVWVDSPITMARAAPRAASLVEAGEPPMDAVRRAVDDAVSGAVTAIPADWWRLIGGRWWAGWMAWRSFFRDVVGLDLPVWDRLDAYIAANSAGWWWPHREFVVVVDTPAELHTEAVSGGARRLHRADGPAVLHRDGWSLHFWHGTRVPADLLAGWSVEQILREPNEEVRRSAIEVIGWDTFAAAADLRVVDECDDPANPGQTVRLVDLPVQVYRQPTRLILVTNGSPERDGTRRRYGLTVPAEIDSALEAAAWGARVPAAVYAGLERRT